MTAKQTSTELSEQKDKSILRVVSLKNEIKEQEQLKDKSISRYEIDTAKLEEQKIKLHNEIEDLMRERDAVECDYRREREPLVKYEEELKIKVYKLNEREDSLLKRESDLEDKESNILKEFNKNTKVLKEIIIETKILANLEDLKKAGEIFYKKSKKEILKLKELEDERNRKIADGIYIEGKKLIIEKSSIRAKEIILQTKQKDLDKRLSIVSNQELRLRTLIEKYGKCR